MSNPWTLYTDLSTALLAPFQATASASSAVIAPTLLPLIMAGLTIKIMWMGFEMMRGKMGVNPFLDVIVNSLRVGLVVALGLTAYQVNVVGLLNGLFGWLGGIFSGGITSTSSNATMFTALDSAVNTAWTTFTSIYNLGMSEKYFSISVIPGVESKFQGIAMIACGVLMLIGFAVYTLVAFYNLIFIQLALIVLYAIGPLFVACFAFPSLSKWFDGWLSGVMRYGFTGVVILMVVGLANGLMASFAANMAASDITSMNYFMFGGKALIGMLILAKFTQKVPELAGAMVGHMGIDIAKPGIGGAISGYKDYFQNRENSADRKADFQDRAAGRIENAEQRQYNGEQREYGRANEFNMSDMINRDSYPDSSSVGGSGTISGNERPISKTIQQMHATDNRKTSSDDDRNFDY
jgi:type IV secretion system protein VirB6